MLLILSGFAGVVAALGLHWVTWIMRLRYASLAVIGGALGALGLTGFCLLFLNSDIANMMLIVLVIFWMVALLIGGLQALALKIPWWKGIAGVFFEMALAFLCGAVVNLTLQGYIPRLDQQFPGIDVYTIINSFLWSLIVTLLVLAVVRSLIRLNEARKGQQEAD